MTTREDGPYPAFVLGDGALVLVRDRAGMAGPGVDVLLVSVAGAKTHIWVYFDPDTKAALVRFLTEEQAP